MRTLIHVIPAGEWGAPERYALDISRHFKGAGWNVKALTRDVKAIDHRFTESGIEVRHAPLRQYPDYYSARSMARMFSDMEKGEGIVHVHRYNDALTCILARRIARRPDVRLVATRHKAEKGKDSLLRRIIYKGIDSHLFVSEYSKKIFYDGWGPGRSPLREDKTDVIYNSLLDAPEGIPAEPEKGPLSAVYRGKLKPGRGLETLIDAFALPPTRKVRLRIIGNGEPDYVDALRRRAQMAGITDRIDWSRDMDFHSEKFSTIHFGVVPYEEPEALGIVNLEFMAAGRPQISTFLGAEGEILTPGKEALAVEPGQPEELAEAIRQLASDATLRREMGLKASEKYSTQFSWQQFIDKLTPHYTGEQNQK